MLKRLNMSPGPTDFYELIDNQEGCLFPHWSNSFKNLYHQLSGKIASMVNTKNPVIFLTTSGTGAVESLMTNVCHIGDHVLVLSNGFFGDRLSRMAQALGLIPIKLDYEWEHSIPTEAAIVAIKQEIDNRNVKAVLMVHLETSTGILNDLGVIGKLLRNTNTLFLVDTVSSIGTHDIEMDSWGIDGLACVSYKGMQCPPGLSMIAISEKYQVTMQLCNRQNYSLDLRKALTMHQQNTTMSTASVNVMVLLERKIDYMMQMGFSNHYTKCKFQADELRNIFSNMGFDLFGKSFLGNCITTVQLPPSLISSDMCSLLEKNHSFYVGKGLGKLENSVIRFAHYGNLNDEKFEYITHCLRNVFSKYITLS